MFLSKVLTSSLVLILAGNAFVVADSFDPQAAEFFENQMRPLLIERCYKCHGDVEKPKGGLKLTSRAAVLTGRDTGSAAVVGKPKDSLIVQAIEYRDALQMPPDAKRNDKLIELISKWVALGLPWPDAADKPIPDPTPTTPYQITEEQRGFWSFEPVRALAPSVVKNIAWPRLPIDRFILAPLEARGLSPACAAEKRVLIRRATFDLTGLPPKPEEIDAFLADPSPDAFAQVIDRLLASPAYGERWGRHWLDVVRGARRAVRTIITHPVVQSLSLSVVGPARRIKARFD